MAVPTGRLSRGTIIDQAQRLVGNTSTSLKSELRVYLNLLLQDLHAQWDWPHLFTSTSTTLSGTSFSLPTNYLKAQDQHGLMITAVGGVVSNIRVQEVDEEVFVANAVSGVEGSIPLIWHADHNAGLGRIWPTPSDTVSATLRYKVWTADMSTSDSTAYDADVPVFPYHSYLMHKVASHVAMWDKNLSVSGAQDQIAQRILDHALGSAFPNKALAMGALDPDTFGAHFVPEDS